MNWKQATYLVVIILVAGVSGLVGAGVGGVVTYRTVQEQLALQAEESAPQTATPAAFLTLFRPTLTQFTA